MVFHEITKDAIVRALDDTREVDERLVDSQETRRILDRLYGYEVSPVLWKKVMRGLSAGRVQSVATRLVVEREIERMRFVVASYWDVVGTFDPGAFEARLVAVDGTRVAQGKDFGSTGVAEGSVVVLDEEQATALARDLDGRPFAVTSVEEKPYRRSPAAPFRTSTLQQEASRKLRYSSQTTMRIAQRLYENGYITYMRTDSVALSETAVRAARAHAERAYGAETVPDSPRRYERAVANAQEAHEAIRPAGDVFRTPEEIAGEVSRDELAVYELIFKRTVASQMKDATGQTVSIQLDGATAAGTTATFGASGTVIASPGLPPRVRVRQGRARRGGRGAPAAAAHGRPGSRGDRAPAGRPRDAPARPLHRGEPREGARGPRHRQAVDVRGDHGHDPRPRLRVQEGHGARPDVHRLRSHAAARAALRKPRGLRVHRPHGGRPRPHRGGRRRARCVVDALLQGRRRRTRSPPARDGPSRARSTHARSTRSRSRARTSSSASDGTGRISSARTRAHRCPTTSSRTS